MKDLKTYEFGADAPALAKAVESGSIPADLEAVFRAMVSEIVSGASTGSVSVYVCSPDEDAEARNRFAFLAAKLVRAHIPTAVLVDCDFLSTGMNGIVPHRDSLGFLDLLLYGTSLGVITQESSHGVRVVGAGSFAVTKKSPFAMDAFADARRYLAAQAKCVLFVGPAMDDDGNVHPVAQAVDRVVLVRMGNRFDARTLDPLEEKIASSKAAQAWSVRIDTRKAAASATGVDGAASAAPAGRGAARAEPTLVAEVDELVGRWDRPDTASRSQRTASASDRTPALGRGGVPNPPSAERPGPPLDEGLVGPQFRRRSGGTRIIRLATSLVVLVLVAFVVWWLYLTRSVRERGGDRAGSVRRTPAAGPQVHVTDSLPGSRSAELPKAETKPVNESLTEAPGAAGRVESTRGAGGGTSAESAPPESAPDARERAEQPQRAVSTPDSIYVAGTLVEFANRYVVHSGSFRGIDKAKEEALYLLGWGYSVFIYRVDLESKGLWYRVYVGPFATQEDAMAVKIKLDENPRIRSTRVSKVPG